MARNVVSLARNYFKEKAPQVVETLNRPIPQVLRPTERTMERLPTFARNIARGMQEQKMPWETNISDPRYAQTLAETIPFMAGTTAPVAKGVGVPRISTKLLKSHEGAPDKARVNYWVNKMWRGEKIEPIKIIREGSKYGIQDGKHRFEAYKALGFENIPFQLIEKGKQIPIRGALGRFAGSKVKTVL